LGQRQLAKIITDVVRSWRAELLRNGRSAGTTAKAYRLLRAMLSTAVDDGRIRRNPCRIKGADKVSAPERRTASVRQVYALANGIGGRYRVLILAAAFLGLRWGELLGLRRMDVDLAARTVQVQRSIGQLTDGRLVIGPPKSAASVRTVTIPDVLVDELRNHLTSYNGPSGDAPPFTGPKGATPKRGTWRVSVRWAERVKAAGLPVGFRFP
jgi:integrase